MRALFLPSHVGLGHVTRDLSIARVLRKLIPRLNIYWLSAEPVIDYLKLWGEPVIDCSYDLSTFSKAIEDIFEYVGYDVRILGSYLRILESNYNIIKDCIDFNEYDIVFADEFWELMLKAPRKVKDVTIFGTDFVFKPYDVSLLGNLISLILNRYFKKALLEFKARLYLNTLNEAPTTRWYLLIGPRVRDWIKENMIVTGLVTSYLVGEIPSRFEARSRLSVSSEDLLIVTTVGGTSTRNRELLSKIYRAVRIIRPEFKRNVVLTIVRGPRTFWDPGIEEDWVRIYGTLKSLVDLYVAADLLIVRPGRTTTADIECMPGSSKVLLIPIKKHFEHEYIAKTLSKRCPRKFVSISEDVNVEELADLIKYLLLTRLGGINECIDVSRECRGNVVAANSLLNSTLLTKPTPV